MAPARWPHELEKPNPGYGRGGVAGVSGFGALGLGRVAHRTGDTVDRYGRWLRYVLLDGDNFNARLIRDGYAHAYRRFPFSKRQEFIRLENDARRRGLGLWNRR